MYTTKGKRMNKHKGKINSALPLHQRTYSRGIEHKQITSHNHIVPYREGWDIYHPNMGSNLTKVSKSGPEKMETKSHRSKYNAFHWKIEPIHKPLWSAQIKMMHILVKPSNSNKWRIKWKCSAPSGTCKNPIIERGLL